MTAPGAGGGVQRWDFDGTSWNIAYTLSVGSGVGARYVTADFSGANPVVYAVTTEDANNQIVRISDTGAGSPGTTVALAGANQTFRGLRLGPAGDHQHNPADALRDAWRRHGHPQLGRFLLPPVGAHRDGGLRGCDQRHPALHQQHEFRQPEVLPFAPVGASMRTHAAPA